MTRKIIRPPYLRSIRNSAVLVLLLGALLVSAAPIGAAGRVNLSLGFGACSINRDWWASSFEAAGIFSLWKRAGIYVSAGYLSASWFNGHGGVADVGYWKSFGPDKAPSIIFLGLSGSEGEPYEVDLNGFGLHFGFRQEFWLGNNFGLYGRAMMRFWLVDNDMSRVCPSLSGGLCFRF
jgi:hypothetical protein